MDCCKKRYHPSLHSAPQTTVQSVQAAGHLHVGEAGDVNPGVGEESSDETTVSKAVLGSAVLGKTAMQ